MDREIALDTAIRLRSMGYEFGDAQSLEALLNAAELILTFLEGTEEYTQVP